jgi:hypothetical protein
VEQFGSHGWLLWNPKNIYSIEGLKRKGSSVYAFQKPEKSFKELKLPKKTKEEVEGARELGQDEISTAEPSQMASEPTTNPNPMMAEQEKNQAEPSSSKQSDLQDGQEVTENID